MGKWNINIESFLDNHLIKVIASSLALASILTVYPIRASAEWKQDSNGWWNTEGSS